MHTIAHTRNICPAHPAVDGPRSCDRCETFRRHVLAIASSPARRERFLAMLDEQQWRADHALAMWADGWRAAEAQHTGITSYDRADAYTAGARSAADKDGFAAGWDAALARFADAIGGRIMPTAPTETEVARWTRHASRCRHGGRGGNQPCSRARCIPGG